MTAKKTRLLEVGNVETLGSLRDYEKDLLSLELYHPVSFNLSLMSLSAQPRAIEILGQFEPRYKSKESIVAGA